MLDGVFTHNSSDSGTTSFNETDDVDTASNATVASLSESLSLATFDATGDPTTAYCIVLSDVSATLSGSGSVVVLNLTEGDEQAP